MYKNFEKNAAVKELQRFLSNISEGFIAPSGIYDEATKAAVIDIQKKNSITQTGIVDKETYDVFIPNTKKKRLLKRHRIACPSLSRSETMAMIFIL